MPYQPVPRLGASLKGLAPTAPSPAIVRLAALTPLDPDDLGALYAASSNLRRSPARREVLREGDPIAQPSVLVSGWACRAHTLSDGRRQIVSLILPGDLIGSCRQRSPVSTSAVLALTDITTFPAPSPRAGQSGTGLAEAYALSGALDEAYLLRNITRLGRLSAYERTGDLFLEILERLTLAGLAKGNMFPMPLTQQTLGDALGLTTVHVNRTIQAMRQDGALKVGAGTVVLNDPERLAAMVDRRPTKVQAG